MVVRGRRELDGAAAAAEAVLGAGNTPACVAGAPRIRHKRGHLAQKGTAGLGFSPRLEIEQGGCAGATTSRSGSGVDVALVDRAL